jgi:hypothetical protein
MRPTLLSAARPLIRSMRDNFGALKWKDGVWMRPSGFVNDKQIRKRIQIEVLPYKLHFSRSELLSLSNEQGSGGASK